MHLGKPIPHQGSLSPHLSRSLVPHVRRVPRVPRSVPPPRSSLCRVRPSLHPSPCPSPRPRVLPRCPPAVPEINSMLSHEFTRSWQQCRAYVPTPGAQGFTRLRTRLLVPSDCTVFVRFVQVFTDAYEAKMDGHAAAQERTSLLRAEWTHNRELRLSRVQSQEPKLALGLDSWEASEASKILQDLWTFRRSK